MAAYPRAKTAVTFIICALVVTGVAAYVYGGIFTSTDDTNASVVAAVSTSDNTLVETAGWKDTFLNVTESDGKNFETSGAKNVTPDPTAEKLTATDLFGREFFSKYMTVRKAGMIDNKEATDALVNQVIESGDLIIDGPKVYGVKDLTIALSETNETRQAYANAVAQVIIDNQTGENEGVIAKEALETGDSDRLADIDPIIASYAAVRSELLDMSVPASAAMFHIDLVNGISAALANAVALRNVMTDPLQAVSAASNYQTIESDFFYTIVDMRTYFNEHSIVFTPNETAFRIFSMK